MHTVVAVGLSAGLALFEGPVSATFAFFFLLPPILCPSHPLHTSPSLLPSIQSIQSIQSNPIHSIPFPPPSPCKNTPPCALIRYCLFCSFLPFLCTINSSARLLFLPRQSTQSSSFIITRLFASLIGASPSQETQTVTSHDASCERTHPYGSLSHVAGFWSGVAWRCFANASPQRVDPWPTVHPAQRDPLRVCHRELGSHGPEL